ncbi:hypothetical protein ABVT39_003877 [Epinephelus coioides]
MTDLWTLENLENVGQNKNERENECNTESGRKRKGGEEFDQVHMEIKINSELKLNQLPDLCEFSMNPLCGVFQGHKSLGNSPPAEHLLDGQTAYLGQSPLTTRL